MKSRGGGGQVVIVRTVYSDDPSSIPIKVYSFYSVDCFDRTQLSEKGAEDS